MSVGVFLEPPCHLPPNSNNVVDQQLLTNREEDGTNLIDHIPPSPTPGRPPQSELLKYVLDSRPRHKLILTAIMNIVFLSSGSELGNNEVLTIICSPKSLNCVFIRNFAALRKSEWVFG